MPVYVYQVRFDQGRIHRWKVTNNLEDGWVVYDETHYINKSRHLYARDFVFESLDHAVAQLLIRLRERERELAHQLGVVRAKIDTCESRDHDGFETMKLVLDGGKR